MDTQSAGNTKRLANTSLILGILSFGLLVLALLLLLWIRASDADNFSKLGMFGWAVLFFVGSLILGIPGCIFALMALRKNKVHGNDPRTKRMAVTGLILGSIGAATLLVFFIASSLFGPSSPLPLPQTPTPPIPLTPAE